MIRRLHAVLITAALIVGTWMAVPADAQGRFWVLVNGALRYTGNVTITGTLSPTTIMAGGSINTINGGFIFWGTRAALSSSADGVLNVSTNSASIGAQLKADALPTVASGFGSSPSITTGSTPLAGSVNVGTGGSATSGVINFNGTAFAAAPFCTVTPSLTNVPTRPTTVTTTQLTLTTTTAWTASDVVTWTCISSK